MTADGQTIGELTQALLAGAVTAEAVTERCLARIAERDPAINAFITVLADDARAQARAADSARAAGRSLGPLHGVPISLKDIIDLRGAPTTAASRVRDGHRAAADATVVRRLRDAGAVFIGKTNLHEFALGTTNEESAYGAVRHPLDASRSPGGSSGGSAASVLAGMAYASIGTDTGGSIRIPSAACGLVGLKPSLGDVPTDGVVPLSPSLDHVGPLCRSVADAALLHEVLSGSVPAPLPARAVRGLRVGVPRRYFLDLIDPQVARNFTQACERLTDAGAVLADVTIGHAEDVNAIYTHIALAEAAVYHARTLESHADAYTPTIRLRLEMARYILAEDYLRAQQGRAVLRREVDAALTDRDALLLPAMPVPATKLGSATLLVGAVEEQVRTITLRLTQLFNLTGHPAIAVPCGRTIEGLPVGAQLVGAAGATRELLAVAAAVEPYLGPGTSR